MFAENLKKIRTERGISQEELAKKVNIHSVQFSRYERGQTQPSIEVVEKIANALNVSIDILVFGSSENQAEHTIKDRELLTMFKKIQFLNNKQKDTVKDFLSAFLLKLDLQQKLA